MILRRPFQPDFSRIAKSSTWHPQAVLPALNGKVGYQLFLQWHLCCTCNLHLREQTSRQQQDVPHQTISSRGTTYTGTCSGDNATVCPVRFGVAPSTLCSISVPESQWSCVEQECSEDVKRGSLKKGVALLKLPMPIPNTLNSEAAKVHSHLSLPWKNLVGRAWEVPAEHVLLPDPSCKLFHSRWQRAAYVTRSGTAGNVATLPTADMFQYPVRSPARV